MGRRTFAVLVVALGVALGVGVRMVTAGPTDPPGFRLATLLDPPVSPDVQRWGPALVRDGHPVKVIGFNAYSATTWYGTNWGCGAPIYDLDQMFSSLKPGSVVRTWAYQAMGWNNKAAPQHQDFFALDRVVRAAERHHQQLILTLSDQSGRCDDGHWHDQAWYDGAYRLIFRDDGRGLGDRSFASWVDDVVARYRDSPAVAVWEPVNEPEASDCTGVTGSACYDPAHRSCPPGAAASLRRFFDAVGTRIHALDPGSVVGSGTNAGGQCGIAGEDFTTVGGSPGIDLLSYHDYGAENDPLPSGLRDRLVQARALGKPLIVGEAGVQGGAACRPVTERAALVRAKVDAALAGGAVGWVPWWYSESGSSCGDDFGPGDPVLRVLTTAAG